MQSELDLPGHIREHVPWVNANSRDTIRIMPATNQACYQAGIMSPEYLLQEIVGHV